MDQIIRKAYAKINLSLDVRNKREDGYHEVKMIMQSVDIHDTLIFTKQADCGIILEVDDATIPSNEDNLIYRAARLLFECTECEQGVHISLHKKIPVAAGMAGGSSDAAATLLGLNELFEFGKTKEELMELGVKIGADIPYCIMGGTALSEGIGEILTPLSSPPNPYVLVAKPDLFVSTKFVYENLRANELPYHPDVDGMIEAIEHLDLDHMCNCMENVLETVTITHYPIIEVIKDKMKELGATTALMSGSGPTVFGIYKDEISCNVAYEQFLEDTRVTQLFKTRFV